MTRNIYIKFLADGTRVLNKKCKAVPHLKVYVYRGVTLFLIVSRKWMWYNENTVEEQKCIYISTIFEKTKKWAEKGCCQNIQINTCKNEATKP